MEEKIFTKVDGRAYAEAGIACGELTPVVAVKFARVLARRGVVGEEVISYSQNGIVEKVATVSEDPETKETGWVLTKLDENGEVLVDENYIISNDKVLRISLELNEVGCFLTLQRGGAKE